MKLRCPICNKLIKTSPQERPSCFPFCSPRCKLIDLGAWLDDKYKIVTELQPQESNHLVNSSIDNQ